MYLTRSQLSFDTVTFLSKSDMLGLQGLCLGVKVDGHQPSPLLLALFFTKLGIGMQQYQHQY